MTPGELAATATAVNSYDARLLDLGRTAAACRDVAAMRDWLREHDDGCAFADGDDRTVYAAFLGRTQAITGELCRWLERITAAPAKRPQ